MAVTRYRISPLARNTFVPPLGGILQTWFILENIILETFWAMFALWSLGRLGFLG